MVRILPFTDRIPIVLEPLYIITATFLNHVLEIKASHMCSFYSMSILSALCSQPADHDSWL